MSTPMAETQSAPSLRELSERGAWMQTYSLPFFRPLDPRQEDVRIEDIAHHLSQAVRYGGAGIRWYSVAEHSVHLARAAAPEHALWALLHDASEAYLHDVVRPVKRTLTGYAAAEDRLMLAICERFGLPPTMPPEVKALDNRIVLDERAQNMRSSDLVWTHGGETEPLGITLQFWPPEQAEREFLALYSQLTGYAVEMPPPTTQDEAVAAARAEGVREGLERAADLCGELPSSMLGFLAWPGCGRALPFMEATTPAECADCIRALIPTPPTTPGGRTDGTPAQGGAGE